MKQTQPTTVRTARFQTLNPLYYPAETAIAVADGTSGRPNTGQRTNKTNHEQRQKPAEHDSGDRRRPQRRQSGGGGGNGSPSGDRRRSEFRTNTLTVLGAFGYMTFLVLGLLKVAEFPVTWKLMGVVLVTSSGLLGMDFGRDLLPESITISSNNGED